MTRRITQSEIAQQLGISQRSVSVAFGGSGRISEQTRRAVLNLASRHGYRPNRLASSLRKGESNSVGVIWGFVNPWTGDSEIGMAVLERLQQRGLVTYQVQRGGDFAMDVLYQRVDEILNRRIDAIVLQGIPPELMDPGILARIQHTPTIAICREDLPGFPGDLLIHDRGAAIREVVDHFVRSGRRRLAMILDIDQESNPAKFEVFQARCRAHGLGPHPSELIRFTPAPHHSRQGISHAEGMQQHFADRPIDVDAIFAFNDMGAMYVVRELRERGLRVPDDVAVIGFNNTEAGMVWDPPLASGDRRYERAAELLDEMLQARLAEPDLPPQRQVLPMRFIWRPSAGGTAPPDTPDADSAFTQANNLATTDA